MYSERTLRYILYIILNNLKPTDFDLKQWIIHFSLESVFNFSVCVCVCVCVCVSQAPYSIRIVLSNLFGFHDLLVDFRHMTSKLGKNLFPNYMLHLL